MNRNCYQLLKTYSEKRKIRDVPTPLYFISSALLQDCIKRSTNVNKIKLLNQIGMNGSV